MEASKSPDVQDSDSLNFLESSGALDHLAELRRESRELDTLINDAAGLFALAEIEEMLSFVTSRLIDRFIPTRMAFLIELPDGKGVDAYCYRNMKPDEADFPIRYYETFAAFFQEVPWASSFEVIEERLGAASFGEDLRAYEPDILYPMLGIGGLFGVVILGRKLVGGDYSSLERMYTDRLLRFLSICIQNRLHRERSITDPKTGLFNHNYLIKRLDEEMARVARGRSASGLIMLDIDHFKRFNDTWGHLAGDEILVTLARVVKRAIRSEDVASRFGGEEFCVLLVECGEEKLVEVAERIRREIEATSVDWRGERLSITASFGCCALDPAWRGSSDSFIERADRALYRSKAGGRNRTTLYRFGLLGRASVARENAALKAASPEPAAR